METLLSPLFWILSFFVITFNPLSWWENIPSLFSSFYAPVIVALLFILLGGILLHARLKTVEQKTKILSLLAIFFPVFFFSQLVALNFNQQDIKFDTVIELDERYTEDGYRTRREYLSESTGFPVTAFHRPMAAAGNDTVPRDQWKLYYRFAFIWGVISLAASLLFCLIFQKTLTRKWVIASIVLTFAGYNYLSTIISLWFD